MSIAAKFYLQYSLDL